ncbi:MULTISPECIES: spore germination protein GerPE [Virgibacillus]|uniref:Putative spore germination protein GerPE n=1 Tax=Virgibacillus massiliensis TaxID=1462526 RepID=A0A024QDV1_9BACI|nr:MULTISPECIES: spore germination protein GerPE [Virgibacillus]EQB35158.1 hypothetical protein M948_18845 [Virgibacillus sp. CM-4]MYL42785.1 spore germination protein GerPE [Virgibacillus massiliensis]CDQ40679.1 putative spore germination protein GerPE [Virgibacillus massiliensis]
MNKRTADVCDIYTNSVSFSGIVAIGDTVDANLESRGIAVQKEGVRFTREDEKYFNNYALFTQQANWIPSSKKVNKTTFHHDDSIQVNHVRTIGISSSSLMQIGSVSHINADARIKHFRELRD